MVTSILMLLAWVSAAIHIRAEYHGPRYRIFIFKPLTVVLILGIAILGQASPPFYKTMIVAGLVFSLAGDIFLMMPSDRFVAGLIAFLIAHLFYIAAFASQTGAVILWPLVPLVIYGVVMYTVLASSLGKLKLPVLFYIVVILTMAGLAWGGWIQNASGGALPVFVGAILFVVSDTILAINRFRWAFAAARFWNLSTYFAAQLLIAGSTGAWI